MSLFEIGRLCVKIAGRDAGNKCVVVELIDENYVVIDGLTRRRKTNVKHLEPLSTVLEINSRADHQHVAKAFESIGLEARTTKAKITTKPSKQVPERKGESKAAKIPAKPRKKKEVKE